MKKIKKVLFLIVLILFSLCGCATQSEPMTQEEYEIYLANRYKHYEVLSVFQYTRTTTNNLGGVISTDVCYYFTYLNNGKLWSVENFRHLEYGLTKVCIGEKDEYVVDTMRDNRTLYLTKETLGKLTGSAN